jgi:organic radical activating enzyme
MADPLHDFTGKLGSSDVLDSVLASVARQAAGQAPVTGPISINLDLTQACNYQCDHCIDASILNRGRPFDLHTICDSLDVLHSGGLRSVIFIGGGEPTLHPGFVAAVSHAKGLGLQVGIVSNGSRNDRIEEVAPLLGPPDWVRLSLDAGSDRTFQLMHRPRRPVRLEEICAGVAPIVAANPRVAVGFSFIISWVDPSLDDGRPQFDNVDEITAATLLARDTGFTYISLKPLLQRDPSGAESLRFPAGADGERLRGRIRAQLAAAAELATADFRVVGSTNLAAIEDEGALRAQPHRCYLHLFRQVLTPQGLYGCPAYRGDPRDRLGDADSYATPAAMAATATATLRHLETFDPSIECRAISCLYSSANLWLDRIAGGEPPPAPREAPDLFL